MDEASSLGSLVPAVPSGGKDAEKIVPLHLPHPHTGRAAVSIPKRSEAPRERHRRTSVIGRAEGISSQPMNAPPATSMAPCSEASRPSRFAVAAEEAASLDPSCARCLVVLRPGRKTALPAEQKTLQKEKVGVLSPYYQRFTAAQRGKVCGGQIVLDGGRPNREAISFPAPSEGRVLERCTVVPCSFAEELNRSPRSLPMMANEKTSHAR
jgi:hypothetical protein